MTTFPSDKLRDKIASSVESNRNELARVCSELIQMNSENPPGDCSGVIDYLGKCYRELGISFSTLSPDARSLKSRGLSYPRENFVASLGLSKGDVGLAIGTHMDVVPAGDLKRWKYPPYSGQIVNRKIWGRGACDAKCSLTAQLFAARALVESGAKLRKTLLLIGTVDDEAPNDMTWAGMEFMIKYGGIKKLGLGYPRYAINAEASGLNNVWGIFPGKVIVRIKFKGRVGHPPLGTNALENAVSFWTYVKSRKEFSSAKLVWLSGGSESDFGLTPQFAEMIFGLSLPKTPGPKDPLEMVKRTFYELSKENPDISFNKLEILSANMPFEIDPKGRLVSAITDAAKIAGIKAEYGGRIVGAGDLYYFLEKGIPGVTYGAGALDRCHIPNEFVSMRELVAQTKVYALTALELCN